MACSLLLLRITFIGESTATCAWAASLRAGSLWCVAQRLGRCLPGCTPWLLPLRPLLTFRGWACRLPPLVGLCLLLLLPSLLPALLPLPLLLQRHCRQQKGMLELGQQHLRSR